MHLFMYPIPTLVPVHAQHLHLRCNLTYTFTYIYAYIHLLTCTYIRMHIHIHIHIFIYCPAWSTHYTGAVSRWHHVFCDGRCGGLAGLLRVRALPAVEWLHRADRYLAEESHCHWVRCWSMCCCATTSTTTFIMLCFYFYITSTIATAAIVTTLSFSPPLHWCICSYRDNNDNNNSCAAFPQICHLCWVEHFPFQFLLYNIISLHKIVVHYSILLCHVYICEGPIWSLMCG